VNAGRDDSGDHGAAIRIAVAAHPDLRLGAFTSTFAVPLGELAVTETSPISVLFSDPDALLAQAPDARDDELPVRDLLRHGGYKPTGRGKPSAEYLAKAAGDGKLNTINVAVDAANAVSFASGFPISVVDLGRLRPPFHVALAEPGTEYVFNPSGQTIDASGLLCFSDVEGPSANAVKDAQRSKTGATTTRTLSLLWGTTGHPERLARAQAWYRELLEELGVQTSPVDVETA